MPSSSARTTKPYDPHAVEETIYRQWERKKAFTPAPTKPRGKQPFVIVIPPPNVTGSLHMGHALQDTMMDVLTRYHRMRGDDTLWVPGTDHAGIATQNVVEKQLRKEGTTRHDLGRAEFIKRVWAWKEQYGKTITEQIRRLGCSCDWTRERFTLDPDYVRAVQEAFIHYAHKGLIYRGDRIVNWCIDCASSISDLEVKYEEREGMLYFIRYPFVGSRDSLVVATTRPETMLGDTAVAVHPKDARYLAFNDASVEVPLTGRTVPVITDTMVDQAFGTGAVKVTPAHDHADADMGERHALPVMNVIGENGTMTEAVPAPYRGLPFEDARKKIVEDLRANGLLEKEEPIRHRVSLCERSGTVIQPLVSKQWFVRMAPLAKPALDVVERDIVRFVPERWRTSYLDWLRGVRDWCVSRQLWWGHQLPVWYCERSGTKRDGHVVFSIAKPKRCADCGGTEFVQDQDVLDTWFSSALWPFAVFGWPEATADLKRFYPTSVLTTAQEILHLWVTRMVFSGLEFMNRKQYLPARQYGKTNVRQQVPFQDVLIHQTVLNLKGQRMSKSLGTGVDPMDLIRQYGADATRFGLLIQVQHDQQALRFDEQAVKTGRNVVNKLWNIGRFLQTVGSGQQAGGSRKRRPPASSLLPTAFDKWILARSAAVTQEVTTALDAYRFGDAMRTLHAFLWDEFADWYVEALKVEGFATPAVGREVFATLLQLLHPSLPFVTEALWKEMGHKDFVMLSQWPIRLRPAPSAPKEVEKFKQVVMKLRSLRASLGMALSDTPNVFHPDFSSLEKTPAFPEALRHFTGFENAGSRGKGIAIEGVSFAREDLLRFPLQEQVSTSQTELAQLAKDITLLEQRIEKMRAANAPADRLDEQENMLEQRKREARLKEESLRELQSVLTQLH